jgi:hypothetical protein
MAMIMHEERAAVGHEGRIFVSAAFIILMLLTTTLRRWRSKGGGGADDDGSRGRFRRRRNGIFELHLLDGRCLAIDGQAVKHHLGVGDVSVVGSRTGDMTSSRLGGSVGGLPDVGRGRGGFINVAGVAILARVVVVGWHGALGKGIVVEVQRVRATFIIALVFDPASAADHFPAANGSHVGETTRMTTIR